MTQQSPHAAGSAATPGRRRPERNTQLGQLVRALALRERLAAIVDELHLVDADVDVPRTLAEGLLEDVERELGTDGGGS